MSLAVGQKAALLIGINYPGSSLELRGCVNDAVMMSDLLTSKFGFAETDVTLMLDGRISEGSKAKGRVGSLPTRENILNGLRDLAARAKSGALREIWLCYSGHGTFTRDLDGDEADGNDEQLVPSDHAAAGMISDDEIYTNFTSQIPKGVNCVCVFDCCHSGTMLDLKYDYRNESKSAKVRALRAPASTGIFCLSGCRDDQTSAEAYFERTEAVDSAGKTYGGALTMTLNYVLAKHNYRVGYLRLLSEVRTSLKRGRFNQVPSLTTSGPVSRRDVFGVFP